MSDIPTRIELVELRCTAPEASADFYHRLVGLEITELGQERAALSAPGSPRPALILRRAERPGPVPRAAAGLFHTAFRYPTRTALAAALRRLVALGAAFTGAADHGVSEALYLDDPDGLGIELYRDRPRSQWPEPPPGERVKMFTAPLELGDLASADDGLKLADAAAGVDIGHVHLKVADTAAAERFWTEQIGMELLTRFGSDASFLGLDGYHHHVGANSWQSRGAAREPLEGAGLAGVSVRGGPGAGSATTPDGIPIEVLAG